MKSLRKMIALLIATVMTVGTVMPAFATATDPVVTFNINGGTSGQMNPQTLTGGSGNLTTNAFTKGNASATPATNEAFVGWNTEADGTGTSYADGEYVTFSGNTTLYAQWELFKVTVQNARTDVSIKDKVFKAVKVFDSTYADPTTDSVDTSPHSYYLSKSSPFADGITYDADSNTFTYTDGTYGKILSEYFTFTALPGDNTKYLVKPIEDVNGSTFDETKAYEMAQKLGAVSGFDSLTGYTGTGSGDAGNESAVINTSAGGPGYYIVTGTGKSADGTDPVKASIALTTTDPEATIKAKLTGNTLDKSIDEGEADAAGDDPAVESGNGEFDAEDPKEDTHAVGDDVPYVIQAFVPDMTGYEYYYFIVNDTLSKGLTYNDDMEITIVYDKQYVEHLTSTPTWDDGEITGFTVVNGGNYYHRLEYIPEGETVAQAEAYVTCDTIDGTIPEEGKTPDDYADTYEVRNHEFVKYTDITTLGFVAEDGKYVKKKTIKIADTDLDYDVNTEEIPWTTSDPEDDTTETKTKLEVIFKDFYNKVNGLTGAEITLAYSAKINEDAVIGVEGNPNTATLVFSRDPNLIPKPVDENTDKPSENEDENITGETPGVSTKTYVTGVKLTKVDAKDATKKLAGAEFEFEGTNLNKLVETNTEYFRLVKTAAENGGTEETGTHYLLKDGTYTTKEPTYDEIVTDSGNNVTKITKGTWSKYVQTNWTSSPVTQTVTIPTGEAAGTYNDIAVNPGTAVPWKPAYVKDTMTSWKLENVVPRTKVTATTDSEGIITFTGLNEGWYVLTETKAPNGYNLLSGPVYVHVEAEYDQDGKFTGFKATQYTEDQLNIGEETLTLEDETTATVPSYTVKEGETGTPLAEDGNNTAWLSGITIENNTGVELPATGGTGTRMLYTVGGILVGLAGIMLVFRRKRA